MRTIEREMVNAIKNSKNFKKANTHVEVLFPHTEGERINVFLHGNLICQINKLEKEVWISHCGYITRTTTSRLHTILRNFTNSKGCDMCHGEFGFNAPPEMVCQEFHDKNPCVDDLYVHMSGHFDSFAVLPLKSD